jgi:hypothetical protein
LTASLALGHDSEVVPLRLIEARKGMPCQRSHSVPLAPPALAATINYLAVMAALLTQDRCTKNYYLLLDKGGASWRLLPGDSKSAMGADSGLGGAPAKDYAIEHGDQWASPLYCDANHPQDVEASAREPWSKLVAAPLSGRRRALAEAPPVAGHRRALFQAPATPKRFSTYTNASAGCDAAFTGAPGGAQGTFNWGVDAILRCPPLRSAYLRRLATVVTLLHGDGGGGNSTGVLREIVEAATARVAAAAAVDNDAWRGVAPARRCPATGRANAAPGAGAAGEVRS